MTMQTTRLFLAAMVIAAPVLAQPPAPQSPPAPLPPGQSNDPFPAPIAASEGVIRVNFREFASLPDISGAAARMMNLIDEPGTRRLFVNDMRGPLYSVSYNGGDVTLYLDINDPAWGVGVQSTGRERGFQSFTFHPQFNQPGTPGFGKFYTYTDTTNQTPPADFTTSNPATTHDTVLLEWTAKTPGREGVRRRRAARADPAASAVCQPQWRASHVQSAGDDRAARISACSTWASPTAAAAATR